MHGSGSGARGRPCFLLGLPHLTAGRVAGAERAGRWHTLLPSSVTSPEGRERMCGPPPPPGRSGSPRLVRDVRGSVSLAVRRGPTVVRHDQPHAPAGVAASPQPAGRPMFAVQQGPSRARAMARPGRSPIPSHAVPRFAIRRRTGRVICFPRLKGPGSPPDEPARLPIPHAGGGLRPPRSSVPLQLPEAPAFPGMHIGPPIVHCTKMLDFACAVAILCTAT